MKKFVPSVLQDDEVGYVDLGGAYVGPQQAKVLQVISDLGLETYPVATDLNFLLFDQVVCSYRSTNSIMQIPVCLV